MIIASGSTVTASLSGIQVLSDCHCQCRRPGGRRSGPSLHWQWPGATTSSTSSASDGDSESESDFKFKLYHWQSRCDPGGA